MVKKFVFVLSFMLFFSCFPSVHYRLQCEEENRNIEDAAFFLQRETLYFVLLYLDGCLACRNAKLFLQEKCRRKEAIIYYLNAENSSIRFLKEETENVGKSQFKDLCVRFVPHLFRIENQTVKNECIGYEKLLTQTDFFI